MLRTLLPVLLLLALSACRGPEVSPAPANFLVVRPVVNVHAAPSEDAEVVTQALLGAQVTELGRRGDWVRIRCEDAYSGWTRTDGLRVLEPGEGATTTGDVVQVDALAANLYREPSATKHAPLLAAPYGVRLARIRTDQDTRRWLQVRLPDRRSAWIQAGDVRTDLRPLNVEESLALARRFLGVNYTWGGTSSFGFDCSGFTQTIVRSRGVLMPRDARVQAAWSGLAEVPERGLLQPGDLLFFREETERISHTGIYLGNGTFIHDSTSGHPCVQVSELGDPHWSKLLVAMRRLK